MWTIVRFISRMTGLGSTVSLLILITSSAAVLTGTYVYWRHGVVAQRDLYWEARMLAEKNRVEAILNEERLKSAERITAMLQRNIKLQEQVDADEAIISASPDRDDVGLSADSVSRINNVN